MTGQTDAERCHLIKHHRDLILQSGISGATAEARRYRSAQTRTELKRLGFSDGQCRIPALVIPVWGVHGEIVLYQLRPDEPRINKDGKPVKYETPHGSRMVLDVHPFARDRLGDPSVPLWITEGVRKGDAAVSVGLCCIALLGVWNWRGTNDQGGKTVLADFEAIALNGRIVYLVFDSDVMTKPAVHAALVRLTAFLEQRGARVLIVYLPSGPRGVKTGLDDFLATGHGVDDLIALASTELRRPGGLASDDTDGPYAATSNGIVWRKPGPDGAVDVPLANFVARIIGDVVEDDGAEERRSYEIAAMFRDRTATVDVPAAQFAGMTWVGERLGANALVWPGMGQKDHLRFAIQLLSVDVPTRRVYAHTGWRQVNGVWAYLHAGGAIGPDGAVEGIDVTLSGPLRRLRLPESPGAEECRIAIRAALALLQLLPAEVAVPLLGAVFLAPLRELLGDEVPDFVLWLHGPSGVFKSELLALAQAFFGDFSRQTLPASFAATANALERLAFVAKDAVLAVDDYHPAGDYREQQAMQQVANRLLRGTGNAAGRARMRADTSLRPPLVPRCFAIASGERLPEGHSTIARMFPVAVAPGAIDPGRLTAAQATREQWAPAMAGYLQHLAARFDQLQRALPVRFRRLRDDAQVAGGHRREPGQIAHLLLGLETMLAFAVEIGATNDAERERWLQTARQALLAHAQEHAAAQAEETPEQLFLRLLADGFASKRIYLEAKDGGLPVAADRWGWETVNHPDRDGTPQDELRHLTTAQLIGVLDDDWLLLYPEATFQFVVEAARRAGRVFPVEQKTLLQRLEQAGVLRSEVEGDRRRRTVNVWLQGTTRRVIKLRRAALEPATPVQDGEEWEVGEGKRDSDAALHAAETTVHHDDDGHEPVRQSALPTLPTLPTTRGERDASAASEEIVEWSA